MNYFDSSKLVSQTSQLESLSTLNTDPTLYLISDLQDSLNAESRMHSSSADPMGSSLSDTNTSFDPIVFTVTSTADTIDANDGVLTLREAIEAANANGDPNVINFSLGASSRTITLSGRQLAITNPVIIDGAGQITISGDNRSRIFETSGSGVTLRGLTLTQGRDFRAGGILNKGFLTLTNMTIRDSNAAVGGAITNEGRIFLTSSTLHNNTAVTSGGGIDNHGQLFIVSSTLSGNKAGLDGGAIWNNNGSVSVQNSTITLNVADSDNDSLGNGGGILNTAGSVSVQSSIVAGNYDTSNNLGIGSITPDVAGSFSDSGNNLIGDRTGSNGFTVNSLVGTNTNRIDPKLSALRDNGGYTWTHALQSDSLAIDRGYLYGGLSPVDQRGVQRNNPVDIGAYEALPLNLTVDTLVDEDDGNLSAGDMSLREALRYINDGGIINFASDLRGTIILNLGQLSINKSLMIQGSGANVLTVSGNNQSRVFSIAKNVKVEIDSLTIANGFLGLNGGAGAGVYNAGNLTISNSMFRNNRADGGSAIANEMGATLNLYHSTLYNNISTFGVFFSGLSSDATITNLGTMTMRNATISHNQGFASVFNHGTLSINSSTITGTIGEPGLAPSYGVFSATVFNRNVITRVKNTIIAGNPTDVSGTFISEGYNLIGNGSHASGFIHRVNGDQVGTDNAPINPRLGELRDNGGPTWTHALLIGSSALNAANPYDRPQTDQRGVDRGSRPDIGAYENAAAIARSDFAVAQRGRSVTIPVLTNDYDPDGDHFTIVRYTNPLGGRVTLNSDGTLTYQSFSGFSFLQNDTFTYTISDGKGETSTATVRIRIS